MNTYPGGGLGIGTGKVCALGQAFPAGTVLAYCKLYGTIFTPEGKPVGSAGSALVSAPGEEMRLVDTWKGATITAGISPADNIAGKTISTDKAKTESNESGYYEMRVLQGLALTISSPSFGKTLAVDTTGHTAIDLDTYF